VWHEGVPEATKLNWLAQCWRRLRYPVDDSERTGLPAFEYAWKVFNALYVEHTGKRERDKVVQCLDQYLDQPAFLRRERDVIERFCDRVLNQEVHLSFEEGSEGYKQWAARTHPIMNRCRELKDALGQNDFRKAADRLGNMLYDLRCCRIHGEVSTTRVGSKQGRHVTTAAQILERLCRAVLSRKTGRKEADLDQMIEYRLIELVHDLRENALRYAARWDRELPAPRAVEREEEG
jgi:hypothetical protein